MRLSSLLILVLAVAPASAAPSWRVGERVIAGGGRYVGSDLETGAGTASGRWDVSARMKSFRVADEFSGVATEYSAGLTRRLEHVTVTGRIGTLPPNAQRAAYHLAGGGALLTFYGLRIGPEDSRQGGVSESTATPVPCGRTEFGAESGAVSGVVMR